MNNTKTIAFVAGKSGGHILPCLTIAQRDYADKKILFFSTTAPLDHTMLNSNPYVHHHIQLPLGAINYASLFRYPQLLYHGVISFFKSVYHLYHHKAQKIISTGGVCAVPVCIAAKLLQIPIELHELNAVPGMAIKFLAPLSKTIFVCFEKARDYFPKKKCIIRNYPVTFHANALISQDAARKNIGLQHDKKTILILGGSQGSIFINQTIKQLLEVNGWLFTNTQIIHQTGAYDSNDWPHFYNTLGIYARTFAYAHDMINYYMAADLIICRAGAGTLFEALFFKKPCIVIPLELKSNTHQLENAREIAKKHPFFTIVRQQDIAENSGIILEKIRATLNV